MKTETKVIPITMQYFSTSLRHFSRQKPSPSLNDVSPSHHHNFSSITHTSPYPRQSVTSTLSTLNSSPLINSSPPLNISPHPNQHFSFLRQYLLPSSEVMVGQGE